MERPPFPSDNTLYAWEAYRAEVAGRPMKPVCPRCKGAGWLIPEYQGFDTLQVGGLIRCPNCGKEGRQRWLREWDGMEPRAQAKRLMHWGEVPFKDHAKRIQRVKAKQDMLEAMKKRAGLLTFYGDYGSGKTLALQIVVNELREDGVEGYYAPFASVLDHLRSLYSQKREAGSYWGRILDVPVLALDECTRFRADNEWQQEMLWVLVDTRYRRRDSHLTLFATNDNPQRKLPPAESIGYLYSRMREGALVELRGDVREVV